MRSTIVLSGDCQDAKKAAFWAEREARNANHPDTVAVSLSERVLNSYRAACEAFFAENGEAQMVMLCLDLSTAIPRFELISDGEQAPGTVASASGLRQAERQQSGQLDGLTCVSVPA